MDNNNENRRKHERIDTLISTSFNGPFDFAQSFIGNISKGGLLIKTFEPLTDGQEFELQFQIEGMEKTFNVHLRVMWQQELFDVKTDRMVPTYGCRFLDLSKDDLESIENYISSKLKKTN